MNTLERALEWIAAQRAAASRVDRGPRGQGRGLPLRTGLLRTAASRRSPGSDRWVLVGESGAFLDPFYSPGSDYSRDGPTRFATDLITLSLDGEDVTERAKAHDDLYKSAYRTHLSFYGKQYEFWHNPAVMNVKIGANNILYWGANALLFFHRKLTDVEFMERARPYVDRIWALNRGSRSCTASGPRWSRASGAARSWRRQASGDVRAAHGPRRGLRRRGVAGAARREHQADEG